MITSTADLWLTAYPIATASSLGFYLLLLAMAFPAIRSRMEQLLGSQKSTTQQHLRGFDAYRGFAAMLVAVSHSWYFTQPVFSSTQQMWSVLNVGAKAVPMFAVLSGYLIYRSVLSINSIVDLRIYVLRRFFRIYPVYLAGVLLGLIFLQYIDGDGFQGFRLFFADLFMFRIFWWPAFANPVTWSLYIEVVFYALLPLVVLTVGRNRMLSVAILGIIATTIGIYIGREFGLWRFFLFGIVASELAPRLKHGVLPLFALGVGLVAYDLSGYAGSTDWMGQIGIEPIHIGDGGNTLALGLGCALMLVTANMSVIPRWLDILPLRMLGIISYSVYIIHPFFIIANFPEIGVIARPFDRAPFQSMTLMSSWYLPLVFLPGILFWGVASYLLVERPGMNLGYRLTSQIRRASVVAA